MRSLLRSVIAVGAAALLLLVALSAAAPAHADKPAAQLSVTLTNSEKTVAPGVRVTYAGQVENLGETEAKVKIALEAPRYVELGEASGATIEKNTATWSKTIAPGAHSAFTIPATVGKIPSAERRVTTVASVYAGEAAIPIVRTANASYIEGVKDSSGRKGAPALSEKEASTALPWIVASVVLVLLLVATGLALVSRWRRKRIRRGSRLT